jgi:hypothetical protein
VHSLNNLLQGPFFNEIDLMTIAHELDAEEKRVMAEMGTETTEFLQFVAVSYLFFPESWLSIQQDSGNVALDGNFGVQVLRKALEVWGIICHPITHPDMSDAKDNPQYANSFFLTVFFFGAHCWWNFVVVEIGLMVFWSLFVAMKIGWMVSDCLLLWLALLFSLIKSQQSHLLPLLPSISDKGNRVVNSSHSILILSDMKLRFCVIYRAIGLLSGRWMEIFGI